MIRKQIMRLGEPQALQNNSLSDVLSIGLIAQSTEPQSEMNRLRVAAMSKEDQVAMLSDWAQGQMVGWDDEVDRDIGYFGKRGVVIRDLDMEIPARSDRARQQSHAAPQQRMGRVIAMAEWWFCPADWLEEGGKRRKDFSKAASPGVTEDRERDTRGFNLALAGERAAKSSAVRATHMAGKAHYMLQYLGTLRSHQRNGAGAALTEWIFPRADKEGIPCYLDASPMGAKVYQRLGFQVVETEHLDLRKYGGNGIYEAYAMVRYPQASAGNMLG